MSNGEEAKMNIKLLVWSIINTVITVFLSSVIGFYFQKRTLIDEKLVLYRTESVKEYKPLIDEAISLLNKVDTEILLLPEKENDTMDRPSYDRRVSIINDLNKLGDLAFKLPYQMRIVVVMAKNHFGAKFWNKGADAASKQKIHNEQLTGKSFSLALKIATENFIVDGEPKHAELSDLIK